MTSSPSTFLTGITTLMPGSHPPVLLDAAIKSTALRIFAAAAISLIVCTLTHAAQSAGSTPPKDAQTSGGERIFDDDNLGSCENCRSYSADCGSCLGSRDWPNYPRNPMEFNLNVPVDPNNRGSLFVHDVDGDGLMDFVVTAPGHVAAYDHNGGELWHHRDRIVLQRADKGIGYPGIQAPGAIAGDMDGDGQQEVAYITESGTLIIRDGESGEQERSYSFPGGEALAIANFLGKGDRDAVLQYSQRQLRGIDLENGTTLWQVEDWWGVEHSAVRTADLDGDGRDEVLGPVILDHSGKQVQSAQRGGTNMKSFDSLAVGDIIPGGGLEIAVAEQRGNDETIVLGKSHNYWGRSYRPNNGKGVGECARHSDPDKIAVGEFDPNLPGLEVFARSSCGNHPWVMDSSGKVIANWTVGETAPSGWCHYDDCRSETITGSGINVIRWLSSLWRSESSGRASEFGIDVVRPVLWEGEQRHLLFVKERHLDGKIALVDALSGEFVRVWDTAAARTYAADVAGDFREELIVLEQRGNGSRLRIFWNEAKNADKRSGRLWDDQYYRRVRQNWNYYSP